MVTLDTEFSTIQKLVGKKLSLKELEEVLFDLGMELDEVEGDNIKIDITAERPDMVSAQGISRVLRSYLGLKNPKYEAKKEKIKYNIIIDKSVNKVRPFTACAVVKNLKFDDEKIKEVIWVQEKLHATFGRNRKKAAIGIYPMEAIEFPINYKADKPENIKFLPLESNKEMTGNEILVKHPTGKDYAHLLEGYDKYPFFIDNKNDILSMPPIINSHKTGRITEKTKEVFIECSGHDFKALSQTLNIIVYMLKDMGGEIYECELKYPDEIKITPELNPEKRQIKTEFVKYMTGLDLTPKECSKLLEKMMHNTIKINKDSVDFEVSPIRTDIWHDVDIVDDIVRAYGINNIEYSLPEVATTANVLFPNRLRRQLSDIMIGLSFQEVFTLALTDKEEQFTKMNIKEEDYMKLGHSEEQSLNMIRKWLIPEGIKALVNNRNREIPQKVFEIGDVVIPDNEKDVLSRNEMKMSCLITSQTTDFTDIKQHLCALLESINIFNYTFKEEKHGSFIEGRCAKIFIEKNEIGIIGEINPQVLNNFSLENPTSAFEINVSSISKILNK